MDCRGILKHLNLWVFCHQKYLDNFDTTAHSVSLAWNNMLPQSCHVRLIQENRKRSQPVLLNPRSMHNSTFCTLAPLHSQLRLHQSLKSQRVVVSRLVTPSTLAFVFLIFYLKLSLSSHHCFPTLSSGLKLSFSSQCDWWNNEPMNANPLFKVHHITFLIPMWLNQWMETHLYKVHSPIAIITHQQNLFLGQSRMNYLKLN